MDLRERFHPHILHLPRILFYLIAFLLLPRLTSVSALGRPAWQPLIADGLLISEFSYDPPGLDKEREWVEVVNAGDRPIQLSGYRLGDEEQHGGGEAMLRFPPQSEIAPGEAVVVAQTATGFRALFGFYPDYEIVESDAAVPDMLVDNDWAGGQFALANDGDEILLLDAQDRIIESLNYGDRATFFTPAIPLVVSRQSLERSPFACDTDSAADWHPASPSPGTPALHGECRIPPDQGEGEIDRFRPIGEIQGVGDVSPFIGQDVTFQGIVTALHEDQNAEGIIYYSLYVQDVPGQEDGDPATSDALPIFFGRQRPPYQVGDQVSVRGRVVEYFGLTEIDDNDLTIELDATALPLPAQEIIELPQTVSSAKAYLEAHEGMRVATDRPLPVVGPTHAGCGFALGVSSDTPRPIRHSEDEQIVPPLQIIAQSDVDCSTLPDLKTGDVVAGVAGPLSFQFEQYKIIQQQSDALLVDPLPAVPQPAPPLTGADEFSIATLNLSNLLTSLAGQQDQQESGPATNHLEVKNRKLAYAFAGILGCPTLIGVQEVETEALLVELAESTAELCGFTYQVSHRDSADARGIDVALLSDSRRVELKTIELHQTCSPLATGISDSNVDCSIGEEPLFSRPPLQVTMLLDGEQLAVFVNHFKSKRGGAGATAPRRLLQARHLHDLVKLQLNQDPQAAIFVLGDFNDYYHSPVWAELQRDGVLEDVMNQIPAKERYSYIFDGAAQLIDGILVSPALVHRVVTVAIPHSNADFPITMAYDDSETLLPLRVSDHDPILLTVKTALIPAPAASSAAAQATPETVAPARTRATPLPQPSSTVLIEQTPIPADSNPPDRLPFSNLPTLIGVLLLLLAVIVSYVLLKK